LKIDVNHLQNSPEMLLTGGFGMLAIHRAAASMLLPNSDIGMRRMASGGPSSGTPRRRRGGGLAEKHLRKPEIPGG
jgi:hypothetical protein